MKAQDSASTAGLSVTQGDAATIARVLRKTESMPLAKLCAQIRQENYREWARWEKGLDFAQTMAGRYGLDCPDQASFTFSQDGAKAPEQTPVAEYWRLRLARRAAATRVPVSPVEDLPLWTASIQACTGDGASSDAQARDLAQGFKAQLASMLRQCQTPDVCPEAVAERYLGLAEEITSTETRLGLSLHCDALQLLVEQHLMALA